MSADFLSESAGMTALWKNVYAERLEKPFVGRSCFCGYIGTIACSPKKYFYNKTELYEGMTMDMTFEIIGWLAGICTAVSFVPQSLKTFRTKNVAGLSALTYTVYNLGVLGWVVYGAYLKSYQMVVFNAVCFAFSFSVLAMILRYRCRSRL